MLMRRRVALFFATIFSFISINAYAVPAVTGKPVVVKYVGSIYWPQETPVTVPYLTQGDANALNDLHGDISCDIIISTPGNYHMALRDAMYGRPDLKFVGLVEQLKKLNGTTACWSTSPPINEEQIAAKSLQFKNATLQGLPALAMAPGKKMDKLIEKKYVEASTKKAFLRNRGNAMLVRADRSDKVKNICSLADKSVRLVTPRPKGSTGSEPGSFGNFSGTVFNDNNLRWVASSRIMHRDQLYALCNDYADVGVIFYHQALYLKKTLEPLGCNLEIVLFHPANKSAPEKKLAGNKIGTLFIAKVNGNFSKKVQEGRDLIYKFLTTNPIWGIIMDNHGIDDPRK